MSYVFSMLTSCLNCWITKLNCFHWLVSCLKTALLPFVGCLFSLKCSVPNNKSQCLVSTLFCIVIWNLLRRFLCWIAALTIISGAIVALHSIMQLTTLHSRSTSWSSIWVTWIIYEHKVCSELRESTFSSGFICTKFVQSFLFTTKYTSCTNISCSYLAPVISAVTSLPYKESFVFVWE